MIWSAALGCVWISQCSAPGATLNRWHRVIASALMVAALLILWLLWRDDGLPWVLGFLVLAMFQSRLLLIHGGKRPYRHFRGQADA